MSFQAVEYKTKRVRANGTREWKLWFTYHDDQVDFRLLTKDTANDCYESVIGHAYLVDSDDVYPQDDDNGNGYFTEQFRYEDAVGHINIFLDLDGFELVWVTTDGEYDVEGCSFEPNGPLMPEVAG
jgi:hypothetical protein